MNRREFVRLGLGSLGALATGHIFTGCGGGGGDPFHASFDESGIVGSELGLPDENGIRLPPGFRSRVIARSGEPVPGTSYVWHPFPDGGATYPTPDGGWIYTSNSEVPGVGGASAVRFDADGQIVEAYRILANTSQNCAGGRTPWGTWISCEENDVGLAHETDPFGVEPAIALPALGTFAHEAIAVDPAFGHVYLTEDKPDGCFYRFTPGRIGTDGRFDLTSGLLEAARAVPVGDGRFAVRWLEVPIPNPSASATPTRQQIAESTAFNGGEGIWYSAGLVYFTTKGEERLYAYNTQSGTLRIVYDAFSSSNPSLSGVDNVTVSDAGDVYVAEDGGNMQIVAVTPRSETLPPLLHPVVEIVGQGRSEIAGPAFDPSGRRLYFSSQRGPGSGGPGITYEVTGPF